MLGVECFLEFVLHCC